MKKYSVAALVLVLLLCLCCSCAEKLPPDYLAFRNRAFEAEVRGERDGRPFSAKISASPTENGTTVCVEYLTPETLCGISVTATCGADGTLCGRAEVRRGETSVDGDAADFDGLLEPILCWFSLDAHTSVQKDGETLILQFPDGVTAVLDGNGTPCSYASPRLRYDVIWLEDIF